ncbi:hypothetical protein BANRA_04955 [Escherichia coli]|nr:hypothetical protein BANRA_04955 [Escherichia coli]
MPVHQLNGLTCQRPFHMGYKFVEIKDVLCTGFTEINPPLFAVLDHQENAGRPDGQIRQQQFLLQQHVRRSGSVSHFCHQSRF